MIWAVGYITAAALALLFIKGAIMRTVSIGDAINHGIRGDYPPEGQIKSHWVDWVGNEWVDVYWDFADGPAMGWRGAGWEFVSTNYKRTLSEPVRDILVRRAR